MPQKPTTLKLHPIPFKSSHLSIPPSPFTPLTPNPPSTKPSTTINTTYYPPPSPSDSIPSSPLPWYWQCHKCRRTYELGVTRRCLDDGHYFCAGTTTVKTWREEGGSTRKRVRRHKACASEFDFAGWKIWAKWRRSGGVVVVQGDRDKKEKSGEWEDEEKEGEEERKGESELGWPFKEIMKPKTKDCWNTCDYPSQCRWGRRYGIHTPLEPVFPVSTLDSAGSAPPPTAAASLEGILKIENVKEVDVGKKEEKAVEKTDFWGALLASATRRKSVPPSSPLTQPPEDDAAMLVHKDEEGDVVMGATASRETSSTSQQSLAAALATASAPIVMLKGMIRKPSKRSKLSKSPEEEDQDISGHYTSSSAPVIGGMVDTFESLEDMCAEFAPLERVRSRDSGYGSSVDMG